MTTTKGISTGTLLALAGLCTPLLAAPPDTRPDAGTLLEGVTPALTLPRDDSAVLPEQQPRPPLQLDDSFQIAVSAIRITGVTANN